MSHAEDEHEVVDQEQTRMRSSTLSFVGNKGKQCGTDEKRVKKFASFCARDVSSSPTSLLPERGFHKVYSFLNSEPLLHQRSMF